MIESARFVMDSTQSISSSLTTRMVGIKFDWIINDFLEVVKNCEPDQIRFGPNIQIQGDYTLRPGCQANKIEKPDKAFFCLLNASSRPVDIEFMTYCVTVNDVPCIEPCQKVEKTSMSMTPGEMLSFPDGLCKSKLDPEYILLQGKACIQFIVFIKTQQTSDDGPKALLDDLEREMENLTFCDSTLVFIFFFTCTEYR